MFLRGIWYLSAGLAVVALLVMTTLIVLRVLSDWLAHRRRAKRDALLANLFRWLEGELPDDEMRRLLARQLKIATSLLVEIFELVRGRDQERIAALAESTVLPQYLRGLLVRGRGSERLSAAESLVWFPSDATRVALHGALYDRDSRVGLAAARSLAQLGDPIPIGDVLRRQLGRGRDSPRQLEALLTQIAPQQKEDLAALAGDPRASQRVRAAAIEALARSGAFDLIEAIAALADDPAPDVRAAAARSLGLFGHPLGGETLMRLLDDPDWQVRAEAAEAHGRIGYGESAGRLGHLLDDENWWVRFRAGQALAALGGQGIEVLRAIAGEERDASRMAALVLAERGLA